MADTIPEHFSTEFSNNWIQRTQQTQGRLDAWVEEENFMGERKRYDRIGAQSSHRRTERKGPTIITDPSFDNRWAYRSGFELANLLDRDDAMNLAPLVLPTSDLVKSHTNAYNRDKDDVAHLAALADAVTGADGSVTTTALPSAQKIAAGGTGLTLAKLLAANQILEDADLEDGMPRVICITAQQITDLLNTTEVKNVDYNSVKALAAGTIDTFMGFKFVKIKRLTKVSTTRSLPCWVKGAIKRIKGSMTTSIDKRVDLSYSTQIASYWNLGAVRIYDEGVVQIDVIEP
jgi:hypothetical protein